jgi:hypothetical protein
LNGFLISTIEEIIKLKISCLELASKLNFGGEGSALETAKSYFDWVSQADFPLFKKEEFKVHKSQEQE